MEGKTTWKDYINLNFLSGQSDRDKFETLKQVVLEQLMMQGITDFLQNQITLLPVIDIEIIRRIFARQAIKLSAKHAGPLVMDITNKGPLLIERICDEQVGNIYADADITITALHQEENDNYFKILREEGRATLGSDPGQ